LEEKKEQTMVQLQAITSKLPFNKLCQNVLHSASLKSLDEQRCKSYILQQRSGLAAMLVYGTHGEGDLHGIRKIIKDIGYNRQYLDAYLALLLPSMLVKKEHTDALAERLGTYNDLSVSHALLQATHKEMTETEAERLALQRIDDKLETKRQQLKAELEEQFSVICNTY
jgi:hypothetical protein